MTPDEFRTLAASYQDVKGIKGPMIVKTTGAGGASTTTGGAVSECNRDLDKRDVPGHSGLAASGAVTTSPARLARSRPSTGSRTCSPPSAPSQLPVTQPAPLEGPQLFPQGQE
jgi:hypothetical protein